MENKVNVVIGGTSGMGLSLAEALGKQGTVVIGGRSQKKLDAALKTLKEQGIDACGKTVDISDRSSVDEFAKYAASLGKLENVVNAAGVDAGGAELITKINYLGTVNVTEAFLPYMDHNRLVHFSSVTGYFYRPDAEDLKVWDNPNDPNLVENVIQALSSKTVQPEMAHMGDDYLYYTSSKAFIIRYVKANTKRFGAKGAQILSVAPGAFDTPMLRENSEEAVAAFTRNTAFQRPGTPEEMAQFVVEMLSPDHQYLTGVDLILDGGLSAMAMVPQLD